VQNRGHLMLKSVGNGTYRDTTALTLRLIRNNNNKKHSRLHRSLVLIRNIFIEKLSLNCRLGKSFMSAVKWRYENGLLTQNTFLSVNILLLYCMGFFVEKWRKNEFHALNNIIQTVFGRFVTFTHVTWVVANVPFYSIMFIT